MLQAQDKEDMHEQQGRHALVPHEFQAQQERFASNGEVKTGCDTVASGVGLKGWVKGDGEGRRIPREGTV